MHEVMSSPGVRNTHWFQHEIIIKSHFLAKENLFFFLLLFLNNSGLLVSIPRPLIIVALHDQRELKLDSF